MNPNQILQIGGGIIRGTYRITERLTRRVLADTFGIAQRVRHLRPSPKPEMDDITLARKVETEILRGIRAPKPKVNVNVVDGVVWLRGEVKRAAQIRTLEAKARAIPEVRGVENLLHPAKTPSPTRADAPRRQQRTRSSTRRSAPRRATASRVSDDRTATLVPHGEPTPAEHAERGEGRTPAPFGSTGEAPRSTGETPGSTGETPASTGETFGSTGETPGSTGEAFGSNGESFGSGAAEPPNGGDAGTA
jgi:hypothetical protein